jgi:hypothetical protein
MLDHDSHALNLDRILAYFQSLETSLRSAIAHLSKLWRAPYDVSTLKIGDQVNADPFTNYDTLSKLIERFNSLVPPADQIDVRPLVALRDAMAHGRVFSATPAFPLKLIKFTKEDGKGSVSVEYSSTMDEAWFESERNRVAGALQKLSKYAG